MIGARFSSNFGAMPLIVCALGASTAAAGTLNVPSVEYPTIQAAIDAAGAGDEVVVAAGTYNEKIDFLGKAITVRSALGPDVTTIDGTGLNDSVVRCISGEGPDTLLSGFAITGGTGEYTPVMSSEGGGMLIRHSSPTVVSCRFIGNRVWGDTPAGGGMYIQVGSPRIQDSLFAENEIGSSTGGGGVFSFGGSPTIVGCEFRANEAEAVFSVDVSLTIVNSIFTQHTDAVLTFADSNLIANCLFLDNERGVYSSERLTLVGSVFTRNSRGLGLAGVSINVVANCILWDNARAGEVPTEESQVFGPATVTYSLIQGLDVFGGGVGNIDADPRFVDPGNGDFRLQLGSPCIDAGSNPAFMSAVGSLGLTIDLDGYARFADAPASPDTGVGLGAVIDMGAFEFGSNPGDLDHDGDVDLEDFAAFLETFSGP